MNITVTQAAPVEVEVSTSPVTVDTEQTVTEADIVALTVQPELAGFFLERVGEDDWTIWFEDGN